VLCRQLGWQIFLVTDCTELIAEKRPVQWNRINGMPSPWRDCKWIARTLHDHHDIDTTKMCYDFVVAPGERFPVQVVVAKKGHLKGLTNNLYITVYHFPLCYLIICFSVGIYRQNTTSTISGVFIVYLAT
jgi:hypothetical protein